MLGFTGNTFPQNAGPTVDGHVDFAVLDRSGGVPGDVWGTGLPGFDGLAAPGLGSGPLDTTASYLYLFQTVNNGIDPAAITQNSVSVPNAAVTSHGVFPTVGFTSGGVNVSVAVDLGPSAIPGDPSGIALAPAPGVAVVAGLVVPFYQAAGGGSQLTTFLFPNLAAGGTSSVWGYTSNLPPSWGTTSIQDGGTNASGTVPTTVPEPSALLLLGLGSLALIFVRRQRRG
ncbi:MAG: PEP-CTERM sorting domain-containing protein [Pirellulales bacterium]|nr:PEP-CTERM sorting domain-containing protein [Pirellulales bacterium]